MKRGSLFLLLLLVLISAPRGVSAAACSPEGYTIIFVNGIFTSRVEAEADREALERQLASHFSGHDLQIRLAYNPTHLGGVGDLFQSVTQAFGNPVSSYDFNTILMQIQPDVTTRKILLLGHSQGAFYTDEMYEYLIRHGVPKESIAVYNIATPESYVAGGGGYLTSSNDKVINEVRDAEVNGNLQVYLNSYYTYASNVVNSALRGNITLPKEVDWSSDKYGGHSLSGAYLGGAADRIVTDIKRELGALKVPDDADSDASCFEAPAPTLVYKAQQTAFSVSDSLIDSATEAVAITKSDALAFSAGVFSPIVGMLKNMFNTQNTSGQLAAAVLSTDDNTSSTPHEKVAPPSSKKQPAFVKGSSEPQPQPTTEEPIVTAPPPVSKVPEVVIPPVPTTVPSSLVPVTPGFGGGGGSTVPVVQAKSSSGAALAVSSPEDGVVFATTSVAFSGTADANATIAFIFGTDAASTTADSSGNWSMSLPLPEGGERVDVTATNSDGIDSAVISRAVTVDVTPPDAPATSVDECAASLLAGSCLVATTTVDVVWPAATGAAYYAVVKDSSVGATTTAPSSTETVVAGSTTTVSVVAYDSAGNTATSTTVEVVSVERPLVINEVGWGGTDTDPTNQWIEIKNETSFDLNLDAVALARSGGSAIPLSGTLPASANGSFLVVASGDTHFFGAHTLAVSFPALATTTAEQLSLTWNASTVLDTTPDTSVCPGWCAGAYDATLGSNVSGLTDLVEPLSMERKAHSSGALASSWQSTDSYGPWIPGTSNAALWGTPGAENSSGLPDAAVYCGSQNNILTSGAPPGPSFSPGNTCTFLSKFVTGGVTGAVRYGGVFRGDVASSTGGALSLTKGLASEVAVNIQSKNPALGEHLFFAIWENRSFGNDQDVFKFYFTQGASSTQGVSGPPHGNYVTIPFVYAP